MFFGGNILTGLGKYAKLRIIRWKKDAEVLRSPKQTLHSLFLFSSSFSPLHSALFEREQGSFMKKNTRNFDF